MVRLFYFYFIFFLALAGISCKGSSERLQSTSQPTKSKLIGTWYLNEWDLYRVIYIQDSTHLVIDNHIDTLFFYEYDLKNDTLVLMEKYGKIVNYNKILKLSEDSLVFENFLDKAGIQRYSRHSQESRK